MALLPPSEGQEFSTRQSLVAALQAHAQSEGYAITVRHSNNQKNNIYFGCDRGGVYRNRNRLHDGNRQRDTASRLTGCPFSIRASEKDDIWTFKVRNPDHNHEPTTSAAAHPVQRRFSSHIKNQIKNLSASGVSASQVVSTLRQSSDLPVVAQDVYNIRKELKWENLHGKTPIESLIDQLKQGTF